MKRATAEHYGVVGPACVAELLDRREDAFDQTRAAVAGFRDKAASRFGLNGEGQTERAVGRLGLIAAAGELATTFGLTGWAVGAARDAALDVLDAWLAGRGGAGPAEARDAIERTRAFLVAHADSRFTDISEGGSARSPIINRAGWREGETIFVAADAWREIHKGADPGHTSLADGSGWGGRSPDHQAVTMALQATLGER